MYAWDYNINHNEDEDEMKNRSHTYDIDRPESRHGHKYSEYKKCLSLMMLICTKQHLSNRSWIHAEDKQPLG